MNHFSHFGAEQPVHVDTETHSRLGDLWFRARLLTPDWLKESTTIAVGVFGGLAIFRMFQKRLPGPQ